MGATYQRFFICLPIVGCLTLVSCSLTYTTPHSEMDHVAGQAVIKINKNDAIAIGIEYLKKESLIAEYLTDNPMVTESEDNSNKWLVIFKHVKWETHRPSRAIIMVDKTSGEAKWVPAE